MELAEEMVDMGGEYRNMHSGNGMAVMANAITNILNLNGNNHGTMKSIFHLPWVEYLCSSASV